MASWPRRNLALHRPGDWRPCQGCLAQVKSRVLMYGVWPFFHGVVRPLETLLTPHLATAALAPAAVGKLRNRKGKPREVPAARDL